MYVQGLKTYWTKGGADNISEVGRLAPDRPTPSRTDVQTKLKRVSSRRMCSLSTIVRAREPHQKADSLNTSTRVFRTDNSCEKCTDHNNGQRRRIHRVHELRRYLQQSSWRGVITSPRLISIEQFPQIFEFTRIRSVKILLRHSMICECMGRMRTFDCLLGQIGSDDQRRERYFLSEPFLCSSRAFRELVPVF